MHPNNPLNRSSGGPGKTENSKEWWEARYQSKEGYCYGKEPSTFLVENVGYLRKGKVLDLAMGEGRNAVYLASKGFEVEGLDFAPTALARAEKLARDSGVKVKIDAKDIDMYLMPLMSYDAVIISDYKPNLRFLKDINRGLQQNGIILIDCYTVEQVRRKEGPQPEFFECFAANEVLHNLKNVHVSYYCEREVAPKQWRVQCIARKTSLVG